MKLYKIKKNISRKELTLIMEYGIIIIEILERKTLKKYY